MLDSTDHKIAIIQARMSSSRLPGKVLMEINGRPMLQHVIERSMRAEQIDDILLATTTDPSDDPLELFCHSKGIPCFRGSLSDVLDRYYQAARQFHADVIIRLTADCPLLDPTILDRTVSAFLGEQYESGSNTTKLPDYSSTNHSLTNTELPGPFHFAANRLPPPWNRTLPIGLDVEVCSFDALERAWRRADQLYQREHVMPYLYEGVMFPPARTPENNEWHIDSGLTPRGFKVALLNHRPDYGALRWTVDTHEDLEFVCRVYAHFGAFEFFDWKQVLALLEANPELTTINATVQHKTAFDVDQRTTSS